MRDADRRRCIHWLTTYLLRNKPTHFESQLRGGCIEDFDRPGCACASLQLKNESKPWAWYTVMHFPVFGLK